MKINDFNDCLKRGIKWEKLIEPTIQKIFLPKIEAINFEDLPELQKKGIDFEIHKDKPKIDLKVRDYICYKYHDILFETISVVELNQLGWFYTSEADIILYCWQNSIGNNLIDGYIIFMRGDLKKWFEINKARFDEIPAFSKRNRFIWKTLNRAIPISTLLQKGFILHFNPKLDISEQKTLTSL